MRRPEAHSQTKMISRKIEMRQPSHRMGIILGRWNIAIGRPLPVEGSSTIDGFYIL